MKIPLLDLTRQYETIREECDEKVLDILHSGQYIMGENVRQLEEEFKKVTDCSYCVSCANGTDALIIALKALGIGAGDEVITTSYTFFATAEAISFVGAIPVFVDVDRNTYNIDPNKIRAKITNNTKAIMVVHIFGNPVDMDPILEICKENNLRLIEDSAQAVNAEYKNRKIGSLSDISCFSFFPTKNLGCAGDAGMITTNDEELYHICKALRAHGSGENGQRAFNIINGINEEVKKDSGDNTVYNPLKYYNYLIGHNSRTDEIQAAILCEKIKHIDEWTNQRRAHGEKYNEAFAKTPLITPIETENGKHVYHLYILQSDNREELVEYLQSKGISTGIYYPIPMHLQKVFKNLGYKKGDLPVSEYLSERTFAIPMFPELKSEEQDYIIQTIKEFYNE